MILICAVAFTAGAQINTLGQTALASGIAGTDTVIHLTAAIATAGQRLYVVGPPGEAMTVVSASGSTVTVTRGAMRTFSAGATVYAGRPNLFYVYDPWGSCAGSLWVLPWVNTANGNVWTCSSATSLWVNIAYGGGSSGSSGAASANYADAETPAGTIDGTNAAFTLAHGPSGSSLQIFRNGVLQQNGADYALSGNTITFAGGAQPQPADNLRAWYRY